MPSQDPVVDAWRLLVQAHGRLIKVFETELRTRYRVSKPEFDALRRLRDAEDHRVRTQELAKALLYTSGAATKVIDRLVQRGLVARQRDPDDARVVWVHLTEEGVRLVEEASAVHHAHIHRELGGFASEEEERHVRTFLRRLAGEA